MPEDPPSRQAAASKTGIDILIPEPAWLKDIPGLENLVSGAVEKALNEKSVFRHAPGAAGKSLEAGFCFAGDAFVQNLNREYRDREKPTNVLSFPAGPEVMEDGTVHLGDVVLAYGVVQTEAKSQGKTMADHTTHLVLHGLLHLLGFDHCAPEEAREMETLEKALLKTFGIKDPYA